jgi:hypothetical protein
MERPRDRTENRLFLRLADDLSTPANQLLTVLADAANGKWLALDQTDNLQNEFSRTLATDTRGILVVIEELVGARLIHRAQPNLPATAELAAGVLTSLGREFVAYKCG